MPTRRQLIQKITLNANASSVTFSNIPQNYTDLKIYYSARNSSTGPTATASIIRMNGETSNHSSRRIEGFAGSVSANYFSTSSYLDIIPGSDNTSNTFNSVEVYIPSYTSSNVKSYRSTSTLSGNSANYGSIDLITGMWSGTSSINSITLIPSSGGYSTNSTFYLYGITQVPIIRGGEVSIAGGYKIHTFRSTSSFQVIEGGDVEYLVIAGGGSGGSYYSGGGGAGGYRSSVPSASSGGGASAEAKLAVTSGTVYAVTVGAGGAGVTGYSPEFYGNNGSDSTLSSITSIGGGGGAYYIINDTSTGRNGGSGGGGGAAQARYGVSRPGGSGTANQGFAGGSGNRGDANNEYGSGGGGGAGAVGGSSDGNTGSAGAGGAGVSSPITGSSITRAGGGGGVTSVGNAGASGGSGGGGAGGNNGTSGTINTGGGGGGCLAGTSGAGGSGIVIIRYPYDGN